MGETAGLAVALGNFDGVHRGHRLLLDELKKVAQTKGLTPAAVTFTRHPLEVIAPERAPIMLQGVEERVAMLRALGLKVISLDFDSRLRRMSAFDFMLFLKKEYGMRLLLAGHDTRFGYRREQTCASAVDTTPSVSPIEEYRHIGHEIGVSVLEASRLPGISSSAIRKAIAAGSITEATAMLGHPYEYTALVEHGRKLGRTIGFPTANLHVDLAHLLPATGVYSATAITPQGAFPALVNIGHRPTVDAVDSPISIETYLDNFSGDLYDRPITLRFHNRIRDERRFPSLHALRTQLQSDLAHLRQ